MQNKTKLNQQKRKHLQGQSILEMALMIPILLVLIIGAIEFGRLFYTKIVITNAAREGAYYLSTHQSDYNSVRILHRIPLLPFKLKQPIQGFLLSQ